MGRVRSSFRWAIEKVRRLRALVQDEDHDAWLDDRRGQPRSAPLSTTENVARLLGPGGQSGGGAG